MRGHIRARGKGTWALVIELDRRPDGKRHQQWHTVKGTKRDAERELTRLVREVHTGDYVEPNRIAVADYLKQWLGDHARHTLSPGSYDRYEEVVRLHLIPALGAVLLCRLSPQQVQRYYSQALTEGRADRKGGLSARSVAFHHQVLNGALKQAVRMQLLGRNPAEAVSPPRAVDRDVTCLNETHVNRLLEAAKATDHYLAILLGIATGMRRNEILALRWQDVDFAAGRLCVQQSLESSRTGKRFKEPKTPKSRRSIDLPSLAVEALVRHKERQADLRALLGLGYRDQDLVVARADGSPFTPSVLSRAFAKLAREIGLPTSRFHDLRHTHATMLLAMGENPKIVSERLGHAGVSITLDRYSHVLPNMQANTARRLDTQLRKAQSP